MNNNCVCVPIGRNDFLINIVIFLCIRVTIPIIIFFFTCVLLTFSIPSCFLLYSFLFLFYYFLLLSISFYSFLFLPFPFYFFLFLSLSYYSFLFLPPSCRSGTRSTSSDPGSLSSFLSETLE